MTKELMCSDCGSKYRLAWQQGGVKCWYPTCQRNQYGHCIAREGGDVVESVDPDGEIGVIIPDSLIQTGRRFVRIVNSDQEEENGNNPSSE